MSRHPVPLELAESVYGRQIKEVTPSGVGAGGWGRAMQAALAAHLPDIAACHYREVDESVIARVLRSEVDAGHATPDDLIANTAYSIAAALAAPRRTITPQQLREGMTVRVESEHRGRHDTFTLTIARLMEPPSLGAIAVSAEGGTLRVTDTDIIVWLGGTEPDPADPDAALLSIVDADTLARLREVAEVTAR